MCAASGRPNGSSRTMHRGDSSASSSDGLDRRNSVPGVTVTDGAYNDGDKRQSRDVRDWLSPPASPNPGANPFFDESEQKKTHMVSLACF